MTTYTQLTPQQVFDRALFGLRKQGRLSMAPSGGCAYRGSDGNKCGIGFCIDDDALATRMDHADGGGNTSIGNLLGHEELPELDLILGNVSIDLLDNIQVAHDTDLFCFNELDKWEDSMRLLAEEYALYYTPPEQQP